MHSHQMFFSMFFFWIFSFFSMHFEMWTEQLKYTCRAHRIRCWKPFYIMFYVRLVLFSVCYLALLFHVDSFRCIPGRCSSSRFVEHNLLCIQGDEFEINRVFFLSGHTHLPNPFNIKKSTDDSNPFNFLSSFSLFGQTIFHCFMTKTIWINFFVPFLFIVIWPEYIVHSNQANPDLHALLTHTEMNCFRFARRGAKRQQQTRPQQCVLERKKIWIAYDNEQFWSVKIFVVFVVSSIFVFNECVVFFFYESIRWRECHTHTNFVNIAFY